MSAQVQPVRTSDPTVEVTLRLSPREMAAMREWADERVLIEFERAEELCALGRPFEHETWRASFALQVACALEIV